MPRLAARGALRGTVGRGYFIDIGIPADLERAQTRTARAAAPAARCSWTATACINHDHGWVGTRERFEWMPGALRNASVPRPTPGWHVFVVTNQSGIARGHYDEAAVRRPERVDDRRRSAPPAARSTTCATARSTRRRRWTPTARPATGASRRRGCCWI